MKLLYAVIILARRQRRDEKLHRWDVYSSSVNAYAGFLVKKWLQG